MVHGLTKGALIQHLRKSLFQGRQSTIEIIKRSEFQLGGGAKLDYPYPLGVKPVILTVEIFAVYLRLVVNDVCVQSYYNESDIEVLNKLFHCDAGARHYSCRVTSSRTNVNLDKI